MIWARLKTRFGREVSKARISNSLRVKATEIPATSTWRHSGSIDNEAEAAGRKGCLRRQPPAQHRPQAGQEYGRLERLGDVIVGELLQAGDHVFDQGLAGQHDNERAGGRGVGLQFPADGEAVHVGQQEIEQDQIGRSGLGQAQALRGPCRRCRRESFALQDEGQAFPQVDIVLDEQDMRAGGLTSAVMISEIITQASHDANNRLLYFIHARIVLAPGHSATGSPALCSFSRPSILSKEVSNV